MDTPISIINSASSRGKPLALSRADPGVTPDADLSIDTLVEETLAELDALGEHLSADDAAAQDAPGLDELDELFEDFCSNVGQQQSESEKHQKFLDDALKALDDLIPDCMDTSMSQKKPQSIMITTMITTTIINRVSGSPSDAALGQGCKIRTGETAAVRHRMRSLGDDRRVSVGRQDESACQRGEGSASTLPEVKTEQLGVTSHGGEGDPAIEGTPHGVSASLRPVLDTKTSPATRLEKSGSSGLQHGSARRSVHCISRRCNDEQHRPGMADQSKVEPRNHYPFGQC